MNGHVWAVEKFVAEIRDPTISEEAIHAERKKAAEKVRHRNSNNWSNNQEESHLVQFHASAVLLCGE